MESNGNEYEYKIADAHTNQLRIKNRRIKDLETIEANYKKEVINLKNKLIDAEEFITELLDYKKGLEAENRRILIESMPEDLRNIDKEILSKLS